MKKLFVIAVTLFACAIAHAQFGGADYQSNDVRRAMPVQTGVVVDVVSSAIAVESNAATRIAGAAAAGAACTLGTRKMSDWITRSTVIGLCGLAGERAGAFVGSEARQASTLIVRLSPTSVIAVAQEDANIRVGSTVYVLTNGSSTRVMLAGVSNSYAGK